MAKKPKVTIVEAAGSSSSSVNDKPLGAAIQDAMTVETAKCFEEGVTDPDEIRERKLAAREKVKVEHAAMLEKARADVSEA